MFPSRKTFKAFDQYVDIGCFIVTSPTVHNTMLPYQTGIMHTTIHTVHKL